MVVFRCKVPKSLMRLAIVANRESSKAPGVRRGLKLYAELPYFRGNFRNREIANATLFPTAFLEIHARAKSLLSAYAGAAAGTGVAAGVGGQARRDKSEIGAVTRFRDMFHKFGKKFGKFRAPTRRLQRRDDSRLLGSILWRERASCCSAVVARCGAGRWPAARRRRVRILGRGASVRLQMVGLGATRPCVLDGRREPQMLAAWRRPPR